MIDNENLLTGIMDKIAQVEAKAHDIRQDIWLLENIPEQDAVDAIATIDAAMGNIIKITQGIVPERIEIESSLACDDEPGTEPGEDDSTEEYMESIRTKCDDLLFKHVLKTVGDEIRRSGFNAPDFTPTTYETDGLIGKKEVG